MRWLACALAMGLLGMTATASTGGWVDLRIRYFQETISTYDYYASIAGYVGWPMNDGLRNSGAYNWYEESGIMARAHFGGFARVQTWELIPDEYGVVVYIYDHWTSERVGLGEVHDVELNQGQVVVVNLDVYPLDDGSFNPSPLSLESSTWAGLKASF